MSRFIGEFFFYVCKNNGNKISKNLKYLLLIFSNRTSVHFNKTNELNVCFCVLTRATTQIFITKLICFIKYIVDQKPDFQLLCCSFANFNNYSQYLSLTKFTNNGFHDIIFVMFILSIKKDKFCGKILIGYFMA